MKTFVVEKYNLQTAKDIVDVQIQEKIYKTKKVHPSQLDVVNPDDFQNHTTESKKEHLVSHQD